MRRLTIRLYNGDVYNYIVQDYESPRVMNVFFKGLPEQKLDVNFSGDNNEGKAMFKIEDIISVTDLGALI